MTKQKSTFYYLLCSLLLAFIIGFVPVTAAAESIASIKLVSGVVELLRSGKLPAIKASVGDSLSAGDLVRTKSGGYAEIQYKDGALLKIAQRSRVDIGEQSGGQGTDFSNARLVRGKVQAIVDPPAIKDPGQSSKARRFEIRTPNAVAGVRGTDFVVTFQRNVTGVLVKRGTVYTYNRLLPDRIVNVTQSTLTTITAGSPPLKARPATKAEINRMEKDIAPQPEKKSGDSSSGSPTASGPASQTAQGSGSSSDQPQGASTSQADSGVAIQRPSSSEVIPADIPLSVSGGVSTVLGGSTARPAQQLTPVINPTAVQQPAVFTSPPPPPPPAPPATTVTPVPPPPQPVVTPSNTNVNVDVKF